MHSDTKLTVKDAMFSKTPANSKPPRPEPNGRRPGAGLGPKSGEQSSIFFCLPEQSWVEAAGFNQHSPAELDEMDRCTSMEKIQGQLQDQLEGGDTPDPTTVEMLMSRLEAGLWLRGPLPQKNKGTLGIFRPPRPNKNTPTPCPHILMQWTQQGAAALWCQ